MAGGRKAWHIYFLIGASLLLACGLIGYGYVVGDRMHVLGSPLHHAIEEIEAEGSRIRQRMMEAISGGRRTDEAQLLHHMEQSIRYLASFVQPELLTASGLSDSDRHDISPQIDKLQSLLAAWKDILTRSSGQPPTSSQTAGLQMEILNSFMDFSDAMSAIETALGEVTEKNISRFRIVQALLIGLFALLAVSAMLTALRYGRQRKRDFEQLARAGSELEKELAHRRRAEADLAASEQLIRTIFDNSPVPIVVTRLADNRIIEVNKTFVETSGYARTEVVGRTFNEIAIWVNPADRESVLNKLAVELGVHDLEFPFRMKSGRIRTFLTSANVIDIKGDPHILASALDITEHKEKDAKLTWLASFPELNPHSVLEADIEGRVHYLNPTAAKEFPGLSQDGAGHAWLADWENIARAFGNGGVKSRPRELYCNGKWYHQTLNWVEKAQRIRIYGLDITQRKHAEEALRTSHAALETWVNERTLQLREANLRLKAEVEERAKTERSLVEHQAQLRKLSAALVQTEERERRRISTAIHDGIGQTLAATQIKLGTIRSGLSAGELVKQIDEAREFIGTAIKETRSLTFELSLPVLYEIGLKPALEWLAEQFQQKFGLQVIVDGDGCDQRLNIPERVFLFQALRELCFNVVKHAQATRVTVSILEETEMGGIRCDVCDNGVGFFAKKQSQASKGPAGFGLFSIREHLRQYGGFLSLDTNPGTGARVVLRLPLEKTENPSERGDIHEDPSAPGR